MSVDVEHKAEDRTEGDGVVEPPAYQSDPNADAEQAPDDAHASRPASPRPEQQTANPEPGFTRTFTNVKDLLAFAKAELKQQGPSSSSEEEAVWAHEERVAMEEELLNA